MKTAKAIILAAVVFMNYTLKAQNNEEQEIYEEAIPEESVVDSLPKKFIFGFSLGKTESRFYADKSASTLAAYGRGFYLSSLAERKFSDVFSLIAQSDLLITDTKKLVMDEDKIVYETPLSPVILTFTTQAHARIPFTKIQPFVSAGPVLRLPIKSELPLERVYGTRPDIALRASAGFEKPFGNIIICPEFRYTYGFKDIDKSPYIDALFGHSFSFGVTIKG